MATYSRKRKADSALHEVNLSVSTWSKIVNGENYVDCPANSNIQTLIPSNPTSTDFDVAHPSTLKFSSLFKLNCKKTKEKNALFQKPIAMVVKPKKSEFESKVSYTTEKAASLS